MMMENTATVDAGCRGEDLGREIGAMYREIHAAVHEMSSVDEDDEDFDFGEEDDDEEEAEDEDDDDEEDGD